MIAHAPKRYAGRRRAFTLVEVAVTAFLLAAAMTLTVHTLGAIATQRRSVERRLWATQEVANLMERLSATPWDRLTEETARGATLSEAAQRFLPDAKLAVTIEDDKAEQTKRIAIRLRWRSRPGIWEAPVRLSAWINRRAAP